MGSHTARYASLCAQFAKSGGEEAYAERARRSFNWATYMADENGWVRVGTDEPDYHNQCWFTDGYFDYVPHFLDGMACLPETAPRSRDYLLQSSSVVQQITYNPLHIQYRTFDETAVDMFRLTFTPQSIECTGRLLPEVEDPSSDMGWRFDPRLGVLQVRHDFPFVEVRGR